MTKIRSNEGTSLAYDGTPEVGGPLHPSLAAGARVVINPGVNEVSDNDYAVLYHDRNFRKHVETGYLVVVDDDGKPILPPQPEAYQPPPPDAETDPDVLFPVREKPLVSPEEHNAALNSGADEVVDPAPAKLPKKRQGDVDAYYAMTEADRAVTYPTLTGQAKADVDADPRAPKVTA